MVVDAVEISFPFVADESKLSLCRIDGGQDGTGHLAILRAHLASRSLHAVLLVVLRFEGVPFGERVLDFNPVSLDELQEALCPNFSKTSGSCQVGMQIEITCVSALSGEECEIVLEVLPDTFVACIHLVVFPYDCIQNGIVAVKSVQSFLQVLRSVICAWAVPDWIVEDDFAVGYLLDECVDDGPHVFRVSVRSDGSAFGSCASAIVRA